MGCPSWMGLTSPVSNDPFRARTTRAPFPSSVGAYRMATSRPAALLGRAMRIYPAPGWRSAQVPRCGCEAPAQGGARTNREGTLRRSADGEKQAPGTGASKVRATSPSDRTALVSSLPSELRQEKGDAEAERGERIGGDETSADQRDGALVV